MIPNELIVASRVSEEVLSGYTPKPAKRHVIELRIITQKEEQSALSDLFSRCYTYRVRYTKVANQLIKRFLDDPDTKQAIQAIQEARSQHETAVSIASYRRVRERYRLHQEHPFREEIRKALEGAELSATSMGIPAHVAQSIEYDVYQAASRRLGNRRGKLRYPSLKEFRVIEGKNNETNITFDPRPKEMRLLISGKEYKVAPKRTSDFLERQKELTHAYITHSRESGHIHYCRVIRRLTKNHGRIEWGYWLQLVVEGTPPRRQNTPAVATERSVAGLVLEPSLAAAYREGECLIAPLGERPETKTAEGNHYEDALRYHLREQSDYQTRKSRYHKWAKRLLQGTTILYTTAMPIKQACDHHMLRQSLEDVARHTHTGLVTLPIDLRRAEAYEPKPAQTSDEISPAKPYRYFRPWKIAYILTCLTREKDKGRHPSYKLLIDEAVATKRLVRFRRAMLKETREKETQEMGERNLSEELQRWTSAVKPVPGPDNRKDGRDLRTDNNESCQKALPRSTTKKVIPSEMEPKPLVVDGINEKGEIDSSYSFVYQQLSSWIVYLPESVIRGRYKLSLKAMRFLYLMIALAEKRVFRKKAVPDKKAEPFTAVVTPHFLSYLDKGKQETAKLLSELETAFQKEDSVLLPWRKQLRKVRFLEEIRPAREEEIPRYYLGIRKMYSVTVSREFMEYLYARERYLLPLHVLMDCREAYQSRLIAYLVMRVQQIKKEGGSTAAFQRVDMDMATLVSLIGLPPSMASPLHGPSVYQRYIVPLLTVVERYFYQGDLNFALWCPASYFSEEALRVEQGRFELYLKLPPRTTLPKAEYDELTRDSVYYKQMLHDLIRLAGQSVDEALRQLSRVGLWETIEENPLFYRCVWSTVSRMLWFMGTPERKRPDDTPRGVETSLRTQLYTELAILRQYAQKNRDQDDKGV